MSEREGEREREREIERPLFFSQRKSESERDREVSEWGRALPFPSPLHWPLPLLLRQRERAGPLPLLLPPLLPLLPSLNIACESVTSSARACKSVLACESVQERFSHFRSRCPSQEKERISLPLPVPLPLPQRQSSLSRVSNLMRERARAC